MLTHRSFQFKLLFLCGFLCLIGIIIGLMGYWGLQSVNREYSVIINRTIPKTRLINKMFLDFKEVRINLRTLGLSGLTQENAKTAIKATQAAIDDYNAADSEYKYKKTEEALKRIEDFIPGQKEVYSLVNDTWLPFQKLGQHVIELYQLGTPESKKQLMEIFLKDCPESADKYDTAMTKLKAFHAQIAESRTANAFAAESYANIMVLMTLIIGLTTGLIVAYMISSSIAKALSHVSQGLESSAVTVGSAANEIASASEGLSASSTEQAAALQETTAALQETSAMISQNAQNAVKSAELSQISQTAATKGKEAVGQMILAIGEISKSNEDIVQQIESSNTEMTEIIQVITNIANQTKVINDIVFQTKLLSFNASVEAARAGEHGKGFAVVAEEVGNLATMSGNAAKEITTMLADSVQKVEQIVSHTKNKVESLIVIGKDRVQTGRNTADHCGKILEDIVANVIQVGELVSEISTASQEQTRGVEEINKAMQQLDQVAQQNNSASQNASSSASDLKKQVEELSFMVDQLNKIIRGA